MGAGASLGDNLDEASVKALTGNRFDAAKFKELAVDGKITKEQFENATKNQCENVRKTGPALDSSASAPELTLFGDR